MNKKNNTGHRGAVYAGSFDPPTNGHLWMIERGANLFNTLTVAIGENSAKRAGFSIEKRIEMLRKITAHLKNVTVCAFHDEYLVHFAARQKASYILRGIRNHTDYGYEQALRYLNADLVEEITTIFLMPPRELAEVSSSTIKALIGPKGWERVIKKLVPRPVFEAIKQSRK